MSITYELTYLDKSQERSGDNLKSLSGNIEKITDRKLCRLVYEESQWLILEIRNIKELVEYQNEITFP